MMSAAGEVRPFLTGPRRWIVAVAPRRSANLAKGAIGRSATGAVARLSVNLGRASATLARLSRNPGRAEASPPGGGPSA